MAKNHAPRFLAIVDDARKNIEECAVDDVKTRLDNGEELLLIDVREESEFANAHIPGAKHLGKGIIERDIEKEVPETDTEMILYCGGGYRSALAADNLRKMGYTKAISMDGGFRGWKEAGLPTES
ncbi:MAG: sulfurtransferase [Planctomycetaceae bacterium]|nr:sulfurtransferase [Planctomycetaceae bacterium]